jgi:AGZA family xanthine/uracil permease-like MFS transporter
MIARRKVREIHPIMWALVPLFAAYFADGWLSAHVF